MANQYGIFENGIFNCKYACSQFEARKHCVEEAKKKAKELEKDSNYGKFNEESSVLVYGAVPPTPGMYIQNAVPEPESKCNSFNLINATKTWWYSTPSIHIVYNLSFSPIYRVETDLSSKYDVDIVKTEVGSRKVIRDLNDPRDALLAEIEGVVKSMSGSNPKTNDVAEEPVSKSNTNTGTDTEVTSDSSFESDDGEKKSSKN